MTPDEIVNRIFAIQNERDSQSDPGDIVIDVQDDMPLVAIWQKNFISLHPIGMGGSIQEALENALKNVESNVSSYD